MNNTVTVIGAGLAGSEAAWQLAQRGNGKNSHHIIESMFKAFARALKEAAMVDPTVKGVMSTKGCL